jgi:drug/metabolite transporter (DMT)-like permease
MSGTFALGAVTTPFAWVTPSLRDLMFLVGIGAISVGAQFAINRSLKLAPASVVVPYQYSMIVWAVMFGYIVFDDKPTMATIAGAAIIIGAGLYIFLRERKLGRGETVVSPPV